MADKSQRTFIIDCHSCKAKVAAVEVGRAERQGLHDPPGDPYGERVLLGQCPSCRSILVGESNQVDFAGYDAEDDRWSDVVRVFPKPPKSFSSYRIPRVVTDSLNEADRSLQANANVAACVMLGRALEGVCRDVLDKEDSNPLAKPRSRKKIMLAEGIRKLRDEKVIDDRLYEWSQQLQAFRNLAAHPEDISIEREDVEDLQAFVYATVEYVYDLTDRYEEFRLRVEQRDKRKKR